MKAYNILALATVPAICISLSSCSRDAEDYVSDIAAVFNEAADLLATATPSNSDQVADEINELVEKLAKIQEEAKNDGDKLKKELEGKSTEEKMEIMRPLVDAGMRVGLEMEKAERNGAMRNMKLKKAVISLMMAKSM